MTEPEPAVPRQEGPRERLASIAAFGRAMNSADTSVDVAEFVAGAIRDASVASSVSISHWEPDSGILRTLVNVGDLADWEEKRPVSEVYNYETYSVLADVVAAGKAAVYRVDDPACPASERANLQHLGKHSSLIAAIRYGGRTWGELYLTRSADKPPFTEDDLDFADGVAGFVAMAFAQGERLDAVTRVAFRDPLTGLANRGALDDALAGAFESRRRGGGDVGIVLLDVNGLKTVNDVSGHDAGDRLLVAVAGVVGSGASLAADGLAARLGGDEFCILLREATVEETVQVAEHVCAEAWRVSPHGVSCGVACTAVESLAVVDSPRRLLRIADAAQYRAKRMRSLRPVTAGREVEATAIELADGAQRRKYRSDVDDGPARLLDSGLQALDRVGNAPAQRRLRVLAESVSAVLNAAAWFAASAPPGGGAVVACEGESYRPSDTAPIWDQDQLVGQAWTLADYPQTAEVLGGGSFLVVSGDADADPAERAVLDDSGYDAVLAAGGTDSTGVGWLLEVYADDLSVDFTGLAQALRALVAAALAVTEPAREADRAGGGKQA